MYMYAIKMFQRVLCNSWCFEMLAKERDRQRINTPYVWFSRAHRNFSDTVKYLRKTFSALPALAVAFSSFVPLKRTAGLAFCHWYFARHHNFWFNVTLFHSIDRFIGRAWLLNWTLSFGMLQHPQSRSPRPTMFCKILISITSTFVRRLIY